VALPSPHFPAKIEPIGLSLVAESDPVLRMLFQPTILDRIQVIKVIKIIVLTHSSEFQLLRVDRKIKDFNI
jgi:hypothetical protein